MRTRTTIATVLTIACLAGSALAQATPVGPGDAQTTGADALSTGPEPPRVDSVSERSPIFRYAALFVLVGAAIGVTVIPGKRSFDD